MNQNRIAADRLDELQSVKNDGRGVSCVRSIIFELHRNNTVSASVITSTELDKISCYPDIARYLINFGLAENDAHITFE